MDPTWLTIIELLADLKAVLLTLGSMRKSSLMLFEPKPLVADTK